MTLVIEPFELQGVFLCRPKKFADPRGYFMETYNHRAYAEAGIACVFVQDNQSLSVRRGTIRGLHFQIPRSRRASWSGSYTGRFSMSPSICVAAAQPMGVIAPRP